MKKYLEIAKIVSVHGIKGEVNAQAWCDTPKTLCKLKRLYSKNGEQIYKIEHASQKGENMAILKIKGTDTPESAQKLKNTVLFADRSDINLPAGTYFIQDLIGLKCFSEKDEFLGLLTDVLSTGANDVYEITNGEKKYYIPAVPSVIIKTDTEAGRITVYKMEGLFDEN